MFLRHRFHLTSIPHYRAGAWSLQIRGERGNGRKPRRGRQDGLAMLLGS